MNKKGAALALVLIIGVVVAALGAVIFTMANSSIANADTGIKSKEAYNNAKSGYDFIRKLVPEAFEIAKDEMNIELAKKEGDPSYAPDVDTSITKFLGYMDENGNFIFKEMSPANQINENTPEFKNARIQVGLDFERTLSFEETNQETKAGTFVSESKITAWSIGRSNETSAFTDILEKGITLDYSISDYDSVSYEGIEGDDNGGENPVLEPEYIPGTGIKVKYVVGENFELSNAIIRDKAKRWDTFYYNGMYYIKTGLVPIWLYDSDFKNQTNGIVRINTNNIWILTGWNSPGGIGAKNHMNNYLAGKPENVGFSGTLKRGDIVLYDAGYYVYQAKTDIVQNPPGANGADDITSNWVEIK